jgi:hypothetical protein
MTGGLMADATMASVLRLLRAELDDLEGRPNLDEDDARYADRLLLAVAELLTERPAA